MRWDLARIARRGRGQLTTRRHIDFPLSRWRLRRWNCLGEGIVTDGKAQAMHFPQATPAARHQVRLLSYVIAIELRFAKRPGEFHGFKLGVVDELGEKGIAANVALRRGEQRFAINLPNDIAQIEITLGDTRHILAADFAEVSFVAFRHFRDLLVSRLTGWKYWGIRSHPHAWKRPLGKFHVAIPSTKANGDQQVWITMLRATKRRASVGQDARAQGRSRATVA